MIERKNELVDDLDGHMALAGSIERAAVLPGMFLAWCGNLHLLDADFQAAHERVLLRLRYRELSPAEFLIVATGGTIHRGDLSAEGQAFTDAYYEDYPDDFRKTFGEDIYAVVADWAHYEQIAAVLTRRFMAFRQTGGDPGHESRSSQTAGRKWWQVWR